MTATAYRVMTADIEAVARRREHALGNVEKENATAVRSIVDWHPDFAVEHILPRALEARGEGLACEKFRSSRRSDPVARAALWEPAAAQVQHARRCPSGEFAADAMRWRIGNSYYAFLKELYVPAALREAGIPAAYNVLADVLFRVDCWIHSTCVLLYVGNRDFREGPAGRKLSARTLLADGGFAFVDVRLPTPHTFGRVNLPARDQTVATVQAVLARPDRR